MNDRQIRPLPSHPGLPPRPNFASALPPTTAVPGTSRPRPPPTASTSYAVTYPQSVPYQPQQNHYAHPQYQSQQNLSGGYQPFFNPAISPYYAQAQSQYQNQGQAISFGQSLFRPLNPQTTDGYSYSSTYAQAIQATHAAQAPSAKRQKVSSLATSQAPATDVSVKAWRNCSYPGCKFVGSGDDVEIHEGDRHLIFPAGRVVERSEEEERYAKSKGPPPPIQGTSITLDTPEDIEKWIAERKSKWPSAKRVQEKEEERKAAIARGEIPSRGRGRGGRGGFGGRGHDAASIAEEWGREPQTANVDGSASGGWRERGRGRGRGRDGGRGRGRGRGGWTGDARSTDNGWAREQPSGDTALPTTSVMTAGSEAPEVENGTGGTTGLAALGGYDSSSVKSSSKSESDSESESESENDSSSSSSSSEDEDEVDGGGETKTDTAVQHAAVPASAPSKPICKFFAKTGRCKLGDRCRFAHVKPEDIVAHGASTPAETEEKKRARQPIQKKTQNPFSRPSMLSSLLANPIQNTLSQLSQTIRFLAANDFLEGVELKVGDALAQQERRGKVVQIDDPAGFDMKRSEEVVNVDAEQN